MKLLRPIRIGCEESIFACAGWLARKLGRTPEMPAHLAVGIQGEDAAFFYLRRKGFVVVARRWTPGNEPGDIDLIAWKGPLLCIVEVKTRTAHDLNPAETAVDLHKRTMLRRLARLYVRHLPQEERPPVRFDIVSVYLVPGKKKEFVHYEGAFGWSENERE